MSSFTISALEVQRTGPGHARAQGSVRWRLLPGADGWSLVAPDGGVAFHALGIRGRRQCLEFARAQGLLAVFS